MKKKNWFRQFPHPVVMLFVIIVFTAILSHIVPAGVFDREIIDGRSRVVPGTYHEVDPTPLSFMDVFLSITGGFISASAIIFVVFASGILFGVLEKSGMIENAVGTFVNKFGERRRFTLIIFMTYLFGCLGVFIGYENNIAVIPIAAIATLALGGDLILAAGVSVGAITIGFGLSPINPYTVGTGHTIAQMPIFSGWLVRSLLCFAGLSILAYYNWRYFKKISAHPDESLSDGLDTDGLRLKKPLHAYSLSANNWLVLVAFGLGMAILLYGLFNWGWYINEISAFFICLSIGIGLLAGLSGRTISESALKSVSVVAPGAFMVGFATSIKVAMEMGNISDTIAYNLAESLQSLPLYASALSMSGSQCLINFFIPSGSGQALATLPVMIPVGDVLGLTRQCTILAFQIGDGVTNLFNPTLGGLIAMLAMCRVPFDRWLRYIFPVVLMVLGVAWITLTLTVAFGWGPA